MQDVAEAEAEIREGEIGKFGLQKGKEKEKEKEEKGKKSKVLYLDKQPST